MNWVLREYGPMLPSGSGLVLIKSTKIIDVSFTPRYPSHDTDTYTRPGGFTNHLVISVYAFLYTISLVAHHTDDKLPKMTVNTHKP